MNTKIFHLLLILTSVLTSPLRAMFAPLSTIPIERMVEDLQARRQAEPDNALWTYRLGRTYYLAFEMGAGASFTYNTNEWAKGFPDEVMLRGAKRGLENDKKQAEEGRFQVQGFDQANSKWEIRVLSEAERISYAEKAYATLKQAVEQAPEEGLYSLTLASFEQNWLESGLTAPPSLKDISIDSAMTAYAKAWRLIRQQDLARRTLPIQGEAGLSSAEAANAWLKLAEKLPDADPVIRKQMEEDLKELRGLRMGAITPLIFNPAGRLEDPVPVNDKAAVDFDLVGDGSGGQWSWPEKGTAFLVWDPQQSGRIESGRQLFGGYTWQMLWENGFEPLAMLDADKDGRLSGEELTGLSAWFDEAPLGVSTPEEMVSLEKLGVKALHLKYEGYPGPDALEWNRAGLEMSDCSLHPVWDWLAEPAGN